MSLLVYALAGRGARRPDVPGIVGERLQTIALGALDAVVGEVAAAPRPTGRNLRRYDRLLTALWRRYPALLPARFGTVLRDRTELELTVRARQRTLCRQLTIVRNRAQMTVRLVPGSGIRDPGPARRRRDPSRGRRYLEARARAARLDHVPEVATLRRAVRRWVRAERADARAGVATIYHLVPRSAAARYRKTVERAAASAQLRLQVSGPWPAYAFADRW